MLPRRTSITTSTMRMPPKAVIDAAWPDGKDLEDSSACSTCHSGRALPTSSLIRLYVTVVATITPTVNTAARRCPRSHMASATISVRTVMPMVWKADLDHPQRPDQPVGVDRPVGRGRAALVELLDRAPALDDGQQDQPEEQEGQQRPAQQDLP